MQRVNFFMGIVMAAFLVGGGVPTALGQQVADRKYPAVCYEPRNITKCQRTCAEACNDPEFQFQLVNGRAIFERPCDTVRRNRNRTDSPECERLAANAPMTCLDKVEAHRSVITEVQERKARLLKKIEQIQAREALSERVRQKMISILKNQLKVLEGAYAGVDSWKCKNIRAPKMGGRQTVTIGHPGALSLYYRECLGGQLQALQNRLVKIRDVYQELSPDDEDLCQKVAGNPRLMSRMEEDQMQAAEVAATMEDLQELFDVADECMNSIITWANNKRRKEEKGFICGNDLACQKGWDNIIRKIERDLNSVRAVRSEVDKDKSALEDTIQKITNITTLIMMCY